MDDAVFVDDRICTREGRSEASHRWETCPNESEASKGMRRGRAGMQQRYLISFGFTCVSATGQFQNSVVLTQRDLSGSCSQVGRKTKG